MALFDLVPYPPYACHLNRFPAIKDGYHGLIRMLPNQYIRKDNKVAPICIPTKAYKLKFYVRF